MDCSVFFFELSSDYVKALNKYGIEIYYYNCSIAFFKGNVRNHRKSLIVDKQEAIIGGRNIGDEYFGMDKRYNFLDLDVYFRGRLVKALQKTFDIFLNDPFTKKASNIREDYGAERYPSVKPNWRERLNFSQNIPLWLIAKMRRNLIYKTSRMLDMVNGLENDDLNKLVRDATRRVEYLARPILKKTPLFYCPRISIVSDRPVLKPGDIFRKGYVKGGRYNADELKKRLRGSTSSQMWLISPYFIPNKDQENIIRSKLKDGVKIGLITNSVSSTDAVYLSAAFYKKAGKMIKDGLDIYIFSSDVSAGVNVPEKFSEEVSERGGIHSKLYIYDRDAFYLGSYNLDNRSDVLNSEMGIFCEKNIRVIDYLLEEFDEFRTSYYKLISRYIAVGYDDKRVDPYRLGGSFKHYWYIFFWSFFSPFFYDYF